MNPLQGLDDIDWTKVRTVNGKAREAPEQLRTLAGGTAAQARRVVAWLFQEVLHQSTPAPDAVTFVPFLIALATQPKQPARWELLALLGDLACGGDHCPFLLGTLDLSVAEPLHSAVRAGAPALAPWLGDRGEQVRAAAAFALAWLPEQAADTLARIRTQLDREDAAVARASLLLALATLAPGEDLSRFKAALKEKEACLRAAGLVGLARAGALTEAAAPAVLEVLQAPAVAGLCWHHGRPGGLAIRAALHAARSGHAELLRALVFSDAGHLVLAPVVQEMFPGPIDRHTLTDAERQFLDRLTAEPARFALVAAMWPLRGLPVNATVAREALGLAPVLTRMDTPLTVDGETRRFADHFAAALVDPVKRSGLARALTTGRSARDVIAFCLESMGLEGSTHRNDVLLALLDACGDDLVPAILDADIYQSVQGPDGRLISTEGVGLPMLVALVRRAPDTPGGIEKLLGTVRVVTDFQIEHNGPLLAEALRALAPERRAPLVARFYGGATVESSTRWLDPLVIDSPHPLVTQAMVNRLQQLRQCYAIERKYGGVLFSQGHSPAALKKLAPRDHPLAQEITAPMRQYAAAVAAAGRRKEASQVEAAIEAFLKG